MAGGGDSGPAFSPSPMMAQFATFMPRRPMKDDSNFDITAMIDLVFMMNIFFLVTSLTKANSEVELPTAGFCVPADEAECVVISIVSGKDPENPIVFIGSEGDKGITDQQEQQDQIAAAVEKGIAEKKNKVLIKAEKNILVKHTVRLASAASAVEGEKQTLYAVMEVDKKE